MRTLQTVSYLVPPLHKTPSPQDDTTTQIESPASNARTYSRLLETFQFVLDVMGCTCDPPQAFPSKSKKHDSGVDPRAYILPGGDAWRSAVRVRMLHGVARRRARERLTTSGTWGEEDSEGVPISQEDVSATFVSLFPTIPVQCR